MIEVWDLWFPDAGTTGVSFARSRVDAEAAGDRLLVHAAPSRLDVTVRSEDGEMLARGEKLERHEKGPMSFLVRRDREITLEDGWPTEADLGRLVILPGGEAASSRSGGTPRTRVSGAGAWSSTTTPEPIREGWSIAPVPALEVPIQQGRPLTAPTR